MKATDRVEAFLKANEHADFCGECLAKATHLGVGSVYEAVRKLEGFRTFQRTFGGCSSCKRQRLVIRAA